MPPMNPRDDDTITLVSSDDVRITVKKGIITRSLLIKSIIDDEKIGSASEPIPVPNVSSKILKKVIEYCEHHKQDPIPSDPDQPDPTRRRSITIEGWDKTFVAVEQGMLFDIILAANYLDIGELLDLGSKAVANMIQGKTVEEMREILHVENDFTPEEEAQIRKENEWAESN